MSEFVINGYRLECGGACPEQYSVYRNGREVGYLRLRHGKFTAEVLVNKKYNQVYRASTKGDGIFEDDERMIYLNEAIKRIDYELNRTNFSEYHPENSEFYVVFDLANPYQLSRRYHCWFDTKEQALEHIKFDKRNYSATLSAPIKLEINDVAGKSCYALFDLCNGHKPVVRYLWLFDNKKQVDLFLRQRKTVKNAVELSAPIKVKIA